MGVSPRTQKQTLISPNRSLCPLPLSVLGLCLGVCSPPGHETLGHPLGASGKIFLVEKERHTGEEVSSLVQVVTVTVADNWGPGRRA